MRRWFEFSSGAEEKAPVVLEERPAASPAPPEPAPRATAVSRFGITKVVEMVNSQHLSGLSPDAKRCAVMMALEAVEVGIEELLQDAVIRQRALADDEQERQSALRRFEEAKADENAALQTELDSITARFNSQMQANLDEVAREQDKFRFWQRKKQQETQQIAEAAAVCVPEGAGGIGSSLTSVLERACAARR
jgi:hypothetical protein